MRVLVTTPGFSVDWDYTKEKDQGLLTFYWNIQGTSAKQCLIPCMHERAKEQNTPSNKVPKKIKISIFVIHCSSPRGHDVFSLKKNLVYRYHHVDIKMWAKWCNTNNHRKTRKTIKGPDNPTSQLLPIIKTQSCSGTGIDKGGGGWSMSLKRLHAKSCVY